ncbi:MAG: HD-GYP domain-containing protein, partial [Armatimonadetes bacterium]|nr:HD-GYP domain-containing protein [Armatimonadota bacterium]
FFTSSLSFGISAPLLALAAGYLIIHRVKMDPEKELEQEIRHGFLDVLQNTLLQKDAVRCLNYFLRTIVGSGKARGALLADVNENRFEVRARWGAMPPHCQVNQEAWQKVISSMVPSLFAQKDLPGLKEAQLTHLLSIPLPTLEGKPSLLLHIGFSQLPEGARFRQVLTQAALLGLSLSEYRFGTHVQFTSAQLGDQYMSVVKNLAIVLDARDTFTFGRSERVAETSASIARHVGMEDTEVQKIHMAGLLHNVGEVGIREEILRKEGKLTPEEWAELKRHPHISAQILSPLAHLQDIIPAIRHHHERWDGKGYPNGLAGDQIPMGARILAIADTYEAMTSKRRFRESFSSRRAIEEIKKCAGTQFDPDLVTKIFYGKEEELIPFKPRTDQA